MDISDIGKQLAENEKELAKQVFIADGYIVINVEYEYNIELSRCNTPEKLLSWTRHLCEKNWMTNPVMRRFIDVACQENSIKMVPA